jgi:type IV secretory pathway TraG/TraD family ATPase VirD4
MNPFIELAGAIELGLVPGGDRFPVAAAGPYLCDLRDEPSFPPSPLNPIHAPVGGHVVTFVASRAGKGARQMIPALRRWPHGAIVYDPEGGATGPTAEHRGQLPGHQVWRFAPLETTTDRLNPLMTISLSDPVQAEHCAHLIAKLAVDDDSSDSYDSAFFTFKARELVAALMLHVRTEPLVPVEGIDSPCVRQRSMAEVARLVGLTRPALRQVAARMRRSPYRLVATVATGLESLLENEDRRLGDSVLAKAACHMDVWARPRVVQATYLPGMGAEPAACDIDLATLCNGQATLYAAGGPEQEWNLRSVMRVVIGLAVRAVQIGAAEDAHAPPVLALLDNFPSLGRMPIIEQDLQLTQMGHMSRLRYWIFATDIFSLAVRYPAGRTTLLDAFATQCFLGVCDLSTSQYASDLAGWSDGHCPECGISSPDNRIHGRCCPCDSSLLETREFVGCSCGRTLPIQRRRLIAPDEFRCIDLNTAVVFLRGAGVLLGRLRPVVDDDGAGGSHPGVQRDGAQAPASAVP